jgi:hypothetical protein
VPAKLPWTVDEIRGWIDDLAARLDEWDTLIGDEPEGDLADLKKGIEDQLTCLSRFSFSLGRHGMEATKGE